MNIDKLKKEWFPLLFEKDLKDKPISKDLLGQNLVIFRIKDEILCFENRCPHRNVPLSNGKVVDTKIRCNYHGWCFRKDGAYECDKNIKIKKFYTRFENGLIWINLNSNKDFKNHFKTDGNYSNKINIKSLKSDFIHTIENFLDPLHTPYIHKGLLRSNSKQRMNINQQSNEFSFKTIYELIDKQNGLINKLFDSGIDTNIATFVYPSFATIEYLKKKKLLFSVSVFFIPIKKGEVQMVVNVSLLKTFIPSCVKFFLLRPFLELAFYQDKKILEIQYANQKLFKDEYIICQNDLVIDHLLYLIEHGEKRCDKKLLLSI